MAAHLEEVTYSGIKLALHRQHGVIKWVTGWRTCKTILSPRRTAVPKTYYCELWKKKLYCWCSGSEKLKGTETENAIAVCDKMWLKIVHLFFGKLKLILLPKDNCYKQPLVISYVSNWIMLSHNNTRESLCRMSFLVLSIVLETGTIIRQRWKLITRTISTSVENPNSITNQAVGPHIKPSV